jgi:hypothetical protein
MPWAYRCSRCVCCCLLFAGVAGVKLAAAHEDTVTAVTALDGRVWSSGGSGRSARLREWSMSGALHADVDLSTAGIQGRTLAAECCRRDLELYKVLSC